MSKIYYTPYNIDVQKENQQTKKKSIAKRIIAVTAIVFISLSVITFIMLGILLEPAVKIAGFETYNNKNLICSTKTITILDNNNNDISGKLLEYDKLFVSIDDIPQHTKDAFISIEDKRFYNHKGIDYKRVFGAAKRNVSAGKVKEGGSTITQQLVKNTHLSGNKTYTRKLKEARIARVMERKLSKDEILENYLNVIYFGSGYYGIGSASKGYFGIEVNKLTIAQSATLAGIINSPSKYSPIINYNNTITRRNLVLEEMLKDGKINNEEYSIALSEKLIVMPDVFNKKHYFSAVLSEAALVLGCKEKDLFEQNLTITTHFDNTIQNNINNTLQDSRIDNSTVLSQALVLCNYSGNILALNGNGNIKLHNMQRQPGSILKPVLCYAPAIEHGHVIPYTPIKDEKANFAGYSPSNYKNQYDGWITIEESLLQSSNIVAVKLLEIVGIEKAKIFAKRCGVDFSYNDNSLPLALGAMEKGISLKKIANCYQAFANNGKIIKVNTIKSVLNKDGKEIYRHKPHELRIMSDTTAYYINNMLSECAKTGTARLLDSYNIVNVCAKTGTVGKPEGNTDAYCIAYTPDYTVAVWIGSQDSHSPHKLSGGGVPTVIAGQILSNLNINNYLAKPFSKPITLKEVDINLNDFFNNHRLVKADNALANRFKKTIEIPYGKVI